MWGPFGYSVGKVFQQSPLLSNGAAGFVSFALGDVLAQAVEARDDCEAGKRTTLLAQVDVKRAVLLGGLGVVVNGHILVKWFAWMDRAVGASMTSTRVLLTKTALDQIVFAPFGIVTFFSYTSALCPYKAESATARSAYEDWQQTFRHKMESKFLSTFAADCSVWPAINMLQFRLVPLVYRPAVNAGAALCWQAYLSHESLSGR